MINGKFGEIKAIAFDIDGTLYNNSNFYKRVVFHFALNLKLFRIFNNVRKEMRKLERPIPNFKELQAQKMAKKLNCSTEEAFKIIDKIAYSGLIKTFEKVKPCKGVVDFVKTIKENGLKVGILSDFPPEQKGELWGIKPYCDVILGSEDTGILKPDSYPFKLLAEKLDVKPEEILYVGNSQKYDINGAENAGFKSALYINALAGFFGKKSKNADITFWSYIKLKKILFE